MPHAYIFRMGEGVDPGPVKATMHRLGVSVDAVNIDRRDAADRLPITIHFQATREQYELLRAALPEVEFVTGADRKLDA